MDRKNIAKLITNWKLLWLMKRYWIELILLSIFRRILLGKSSMFWSSITRSSSSTDGGGWTIFVENDEFSLFFQAENQIRRLQSDFDELILSKQEIIKSNYALVQNADALREQLRTFVNPIRFISSIISKFLLLRARTQMAEVRILCPSSSTSFDNLDESLSSLVYDDDTPDCEQLNPQSCLFSEINSLVDIKPLHCTRNRFGCSQETMSSETIKKCLNGSTNDIELDFLLAKTTTLSSSVLLINQLVNAFRSKLKWSNIRFFSSDRFMTWKCLKNEQMMLIKNI